jgi:DNA-binding transcriptional LysR family regulator
MPLENFNDLAAFAAVARERSFTRAAAKLGVSTSALSQTVRNLEERLGVRLLTRTTRSVASTEAGERLLRTVAPRFDEIEAEVAALSDLRERPAGTIRITAGEHPAISVLQPALMKLLPAYPDIRVEIVADYGLTDIVAQGYDAGVRLGEQVAKDMVAVRIGPDIRMAVVASPSYLEKHSVPQSPHDLTAQNCINIRLPTYGGLFVWEFGKDGREVKVRVDGQIIVNNIALRLASVLDGLGVAYMPEDQALPDIKARRLVRVLDSWCLPFPGYHLYYPSRRQHSAAFGLLLDALRYHPQGDRRASVSR